MSDANYNAGSCLIFPQILHTLQSYFSGICHQSNFAKSSQKEGVKSQLQSLLEAFRGAALATNLRNVHALFHYLNPVLRDCVHLLNVYQNCPEMVVVVLEFCVDLADSQVAFLSKVGCCIRIHGISLTLSSQHKVHILLSCPKMLSSIAENLSKYPENLSLVITPLIVIISLID